jgi:pimeloyl-ACP methyl ester carboxylesterase
MDSLRNTVLSVLMLVAGSCLAARATEPSAPSELPPEFTFGMALIEGTSLAWAERPGDEPALVLIPGTFNDCRVYSQVVTSLDPGRRTILVEHAGHGRSWPPDPNPSIERSAAHVTRLLDRLKIDSCFLGGHSLGGMVAMEAGRRDPDRCRGIISIEGWTNSRSAFAAFQGDMTSSLSRTTRARIDAHRHENASRWPEAARQAFSQIWTMWDGSAFLRETNLPVLELYGDRAKPRPAAESLGIPERSNIRFQWVPDASHWLPVEQPALVAAAIEAFMADAEGLAIGRSQPSR